MAARIFQMLLKAHLVTRYALLPYDFMFQLTFKEKEGVVVICDGCQWSASFDFSTHLENSSGQEFAC